MSSLISLCCAMCLRIFFALSLLFVSSARAVKSIVTLAARRSAASCATLLLFLFVVWPCC